MHLPLHSAAIMFDVLVYLYENINALSACPDSAALTKKLSAAGFEKDEIAEALSWLQGLAHVARESVTVQGESGPAIRIYAASEYERLGADAINFITFLERGGTVTSTQREIAIERALATRENTVPLAKFKVIVLMVLWSQQVNIDLLVLEELLDHREGRLLH